MKSKSQKNIKKTSSEPQFKIGDLVRHKYPDLSSNPQGIGLIVAISTDLSFGIDEEVFADIIYVYLIEWTRDSSRTYLYEMFVEKYVPQK